MSKQSKANDRATVKKALEFAVVSKNEDQRVVYGWFSVVETADGKPIVDLQGDFISPEDLEAASWQFVKEWRQGGEMHVGRAPNDLVASLVFTPEMKKALGIPDGCIPSGWFGGFRVPDATFAKVKGGSRLMFSIEGEADKEPVNLELEGVA